MKASTIELETEEPTADPVVNSSRRNFTKRSMQALLTISLLDHLYSANLLAAGAKMTAKKWLNEVNQIGLDVQGKKIKGPNGRLRSRICCKIKLPFLNYLS